MLAPARNDPNRDAMRAVQKKHPWMWGNASGVIPDGTTPEVERKPDPETEIKQRHEGQKIIEQAAPGAAKKLAKKS